MMRRIVRHYSLSPTRHNSISPCGRLDQIMILFARDGLGTHYNPKTSSVNYVPLGAGAADFRIVVLDTGTARPGLEKSTYKVRRAECEQLLAILQRAGYDISSLADFMQTGTKFYRPAPVGAR